MKAYLFKTEMPKYHEYWLLSLDPATEYSVNVNVYTCGSIDWAEEQPRDTELNFFTSVEEWDDSFENLEYVEVDPYFSVQVCQKYYFPSFNRDREDFSYQWYDAGDADALALLIKEAIRLAADKAGIVLGSR